jgi:PAS domain S-box-containing protein
VLNDDLPAENRDKSAIEPGLRSTERKIRLGFAFALVCLAVVGTVSYLSVVDLNTHAARVGHTQEVMSRLELLLAAATDSETAERGFVITGDESYLLPYQQSAEAVDVHVQNLRELTADNPIQQERLAAITPLVSERLRNLRHVIELRRIRGFEAARAEILTGAGKQFHDRIRGLIDQMKQTEMSLLGERERQAHRSATRTRAVIIGGNVLAFGLVALALWLIRRDFAGRTRAERALRDAQAGLEARVAERTAELQRTARNLQDEIAERTRAQALNTRLASIIEFSDDAIASKSLTGIITSWNPGAERLFGYTADEAVGKPMTIVIPPERAAEEPEILARIARGEVTDHFETVRIRKDGRKIDVSVTISPLRDSSGTIVGASKIARDITERKAAQRKLHTQLQRLNLLQQITHAIGERQDTQSIFQVVVRTLEEQLPVDLACIALHDPADHTLTVSSVGVRSGPLVMELALTQQARIPIDANGLSRCMAGQLVYEPDIRQVAFPFPERLTRGGLSSMVIAPLRVESEVFGVLVTARREPESFVSSDCEFLKQLSEHVALAAHQAQLHSALQKAYDDLRQTQQAILQRERLRALGEMASGIAHDINNAISPVTLYTDSLLENEPNLSERARGYLQTIQRAIDDVAQTVSRMREFYRPRESQLSLAPVQLNHLIGQVLDLTRARWSDMAHQRGIAIEVQTQLSPSLPSVMGADSELREALTNLVFNAVDAMPDGGTLTLRTGVVDAREASSVFLEISDTGIGMDENTRRRCLEPFFTTKGERGTGLGLAMVYGTVQRHSADIEIESEPGRGTTMRLTFAVPIAAGRDAIPGAPPQPTRESLRILIVDDDPILLKSLEDTLAGDGHTVSVAHGGDAGIDAVRSALQQGALFDIVITDLGMPHTDGRKVASAVKALVSSMPVVLLTGWGQRLIAEGDIPLHVDRVLSKPPKLRDLREALAALTPRRVPRAHTEL